MRALLLVVMLGAVGCTESGTVLCADGLVCPAGSTCGTAPARCISEQQRDACAGKAEGEACTSTGTTGECFEGACEPRFCGDGVKQVGEECDGSDLGGKDCLDLDYYNPDGLACRPDCTFERSGCVGACGDGIKNGGELCDGTDFGGDDCTTAGFYNAPGLECSPFCTYDVTACTGRCGDGVKNGGELCDGTDFGGDDCTDAGFYFAPGLACSAFCTYDVTTCTGKCGDGIINGEELCDGAPPVESCVDLGTDAGAVSCSSACGFGFGQCARFDFHIDTSLPAVSCFQTASSGLSNVWVIDGATGDAKHFDGTTWTSYAVPGSTVWTGMESPDATSGWLLDANNGGVVHWNGTVWAVDATVPSGVVDLSAISATSAYLVTDQLDIYKLAGGNWSALPKTTTLSKAARISATSDTNVWVVDLNGGTAHWNGTAWTEDVVQLGGGEVVSLSDVLAISATEAWALGTATVNVPQLNTIVGVIAHYTKGAWQPIVLDSTYSAPSRLASTSPHDIWALGGTTMHFDGRSWLPLADASRSCLTPVAHGLAYDFGGLGYTMNGQVWAHLDLKPTGGETAWRMWEAPTGQLFVSLVSAGKVARFDGETWVFDNASTGLVRAFWGTAYDDVWAIGTSGKPTHFNGSSWTQSTVANSVIMWAMWGSATNDVWAAGENGTVLRWNGTTWANQNLPVSQRIIQLTGSGPTDVWAVLYTGQLYHWNGTAWSLQTLPTGLATVELAYSTGANQLLALRGSSQQSYAWNGTAWTAGPSFPLGVFSSNIIAGSSATDVWFSDGATAYHLEGTKFQPVRRPAGPGILEMSVSSNHIHLMHGDGTIDTLVRMRPWVCDATETGACGDFVDNDCDGVADLADSDCP